MRRAQVLGLLVLALGLANNFTTLSIARESLFSEESNALALIGARVYPSPSEKPIDNATVLLRNGKIVAVGVKGKIKIPRSTRIIDCAGLTMVAGFWNSHVHFTEDKWTNAASIRPERFYSQRAPAPEECQRLKPPNRESSWFARSLMLGLMPSRYMLRLSGISI